MPIHKEHGGYQWGHHGKVYHGKNAKKKAEKQAAAAHAHGYKGDSNKAECAGVLLVNGSKVFLLHRTDRDEWEGPGGHIEEGETAKEAALRETEEELGLDISDDAVPSEGVKTTTPEVDYTTFVVNHPDAFSYKLNHEHDDARSFDIHELPDSIHPGVKEVLENNRADKSLEKGASEEAISKHIGELVDRGYPQAQAVAIAYREAGKSRSDSDEVNEDEPAEIDYARAMRDGKIEGPINVGNVWLFDLRITGTGTSFREKLNEYVYRPPEEYLTDEFLERCQGLPVIFDHPEDSMLNTDEWRERAIGTVVLPYIPEEADEFHSPDDVWGIARIYDGDAAELMQTTHVSTSPAVGFGDAGTRSIKLDDGSSLLIEGRPQSLDHLAVCTEGVWDKGEGPHGVAI